MLRKFKLAYDGRGKYPSKRILNEKEKNNFFVLPVWRPRIIARTTKKRTAAKTTRRIIVRKNTHVAQVFCRRPPPYPEHLAVRPVYLLRNLPPTYHLYVCGVAEAAAETQSPALSARSVFCCVSDPGGGLHGGADERRRAQTWNRKIKWVLRASAARGVLRRCRPLSDERSKIINTIEFRSAFRDCRPKLACFEIKLQRFVHPLAIHTRTRV